MFSCKVCIFDEVQTQTYVVARNLFMKAAHNCMSTLSYFKTAEIYRNSSEIVYKEKLINKTEID